MATGVSGRALRGTSDTVEGRDYSALETTGEGWDGGEIPAMYRNVDARLVGAESPASVNLLAVRRTTA
jgi:hypothetical protein